MVLDRPPVALVEALGDEPGLLQVGELVLADGHEVGLAEEDVGGLVNRVGEHQAAHGPPVGGLQLRLHRGVAVQLGLGDQGQEGQHQLILGGDRRVSEDRRALRVHAHRQGVGDQGQDPLANGADAVAVGDDLVVGHEDPGVHARVLDRLPGVHGAEVVAQVHVPGGADPGEHPVAAGVDGDIGLDLGGAGDGSGQGGVIGGVGQGLLGRGGGLSHALILGGALRRQADGGPPRAQWCRLRPPRRPGSGSPAVHRRSRSAGTAPPASSCRPAGRDGSP